MAEYIEREAALEAVDNADVMCDIHPDAYRVLRRYIERIPVADVWPVVRCGECKYWTESSAIPLIGCCVFTPMRHTAEFFCANGERKGGDGE